METVRNQEDLWLELPSLVEVSKPEPRPAPPSLWRIGNKSLFETNNRVQRRANKRLSLSRRAISPHLDSTEENEEFEREDAGDGDDDTATDSETDSEGEEEVFLMLPGVEEEEDDYDSDNDSLPDLVSASEDEDDYEDEGIADCDTFISMDSLIVLLGRYGLNNPQE